MGKLDDIFGVARTAGATETKTVSEARSAVAAERLAVVETPEPMSRLASYVRRVFMENADHRRRSGVDEALRKSILAARCRYTDEQRRKMELAGLSPDLYSPVTHTKIRAAKAMLGDIFQNSSDRPFTLEPTPDPELPAEIEEDVLETVGRDVQKILDGLAAKGVQEVPPNAAALLQTVIVHAVTGRYDERERLEEQQARQRAKRLERKVWDILVEGGWIDVFQEYVNDICVYGTGLIVGPVPRVVAVNAIRRDRKSGVSRYVREYRKIPTYEAVSPVDCYPAPDAKTVDDGPLCIKVKFTSSELWRLTQDADGKDGERERAADGWIPSVVDALLARHPSGGVDEESVHQDGELREAVGNGVNDVSDCTLEGVRCFATVRGSELLDIGILRNRDGEYVRLRDYYQVEVIVIDGYVVYVRILDERVGRPISKGVFYEVPGSWWGESIAEKLSLVQNVMNNCVKAMVTNMAVASGPMYYINDVSRLVNRDASGLQMKPHKMWTFEMGMTGSSGAPMGTIQVPSNASELLGVFDKMKMQADDDSGIPAYTYGQTQGAGAAMRTAQGLSIFTEAASRGMKMVIMTTDRLVIRSVVRKTANWVLVNDDDTEVKGDCEVLPTGVMGKILKAQQDQERLQLLGLVINNPTLTQICGVKGIMELLRPSVADMNINADDVLPSAERVRELEMVQDLMQMAQVQQAQAGARQAQIDQQGQQLDNRQQQIEMAQAEANPGGVSQRRGVA